MSEYEHNFACNRRLFLPAAHSTRAEPAPGRANDAFRIRPDLLIGGVVILATVGDDRSEVNSVCAVMTVGLLHRLIGKLKQHFPRFGLLVDGTPLVLMKNGQWQKQVMDRMRIQDTDVMAAAARKARKACGTSITPSSNATGESVLSRPKSSARLNDCTFSPVPLVHDEDR